MKIHAPAPACGIALAALLVASPSTQAAVTDSPAAIEARYQAERKTCLAGRSGQDPATCLKEAGAARAEALRHRLDNGEDRATLRANALQRCAVQPPGERAACETLARGGGTESGSVRAGGVIRELVTRSADGEASAAASGAMPVEPSRPASPASAAERAAPASAPASRPQPTR